MNRITDTQQKSLFNLADYQIESVPLRETIGDWGWEEIGIDLLPNFKNREQVTIEREIESKVREHKHRCLLPNFKNREQVTIEREIESKVREQASMLVLPNPPVREQPLKPNTQSPNLRIVSIKGQKYFLTPSKSTKQLPEGKGWREIKKQKGSLYLYLRWREGKTQKSGCLGRLDKINSQLE